MGIFENIRARARVEFSDKFPSLRIEIIDNHKAILEGITGVLTYRDDIIELKSRGSIIVFCGKGLNLIRLNSLASAVEGEIETIKFN